MGSAFLKPLAGLAAIAICTSAVVAQDAAALKQAHACRINGEQVALGVTFDGSACQATRPAEVSGASVTIPTERTAEICTMQLVEVKYSGTITVAPDVTSLQVTVHDPDGRTQASGVAEITPGECGDAAAARPAQ